MSGCHLLCWSSIWFQLLNIPKPTHSLETDAPFLLGHMNVSLSLYGHIWGTTEETKSLGIEGLLQQPSVRQTLCVHWNIKKHIWLTLMFIFYKQDKLKLTLQPTVVTYFEHASVHTTKQLNGLTWKKNHIRRKINKSPCMSQCTMGILVGNKIVSLR